MEFSKTIAKQSFRSAFNLLGTTIIGFVSTVIFTEFLSPDAFGNFTLTRTVINLTAIFAIFGMNHGLVRQGSIALGRGDKDTYNDIKNYTFSVVFVIGISTALIVFLFADSIANQIFGKPDFAYFLRFCAFVIPIKLYSNMLIDLFRVNHRSSEGEFLYSIVYFSLLLIVFYVLTFFFKDNSLAAITFLVANCIYLVILVWKHRIFGHRFSLNLDKTERRELFSISLPMFFAASLNQSQKWMDTLMLGILGESSDVGIYYLGLRIAAFALIPANAMNSIFVPVAGRLIGAGKHDELNDLYKTVTLIIFLVGSTILSGLVFLKSYIVQIFNKDYENFELIIIPILIGTFIDFSVGAARRLITMSGGGKINLINSAATILLSVGMSYLLIPRFGILGAAYANAATIGLINIITVIELSIIYKLSPFSKRYVGVILLFLILIVIVSKLPIALLLQFAIFLSVLIPIYFFFLGKKEMEMVKQLINKKKLKHKKNSER